MGTGNGRKNGRRWRGKREFGEEILSVWELWKLREGGLKGFSAWVQGKEGFWELCPRWDELKLFRVW